MTSIDPQKSTELFTRGVVQFTDPEHTFEKALREKGEGKRKDPVIIKFGVDPTRPDIHIGHAVVFRKLRTFQDMGCKVIFLIGDFTAMIGDPTGKSKVRPEISQREVEENMKTYLDQVGKILDLSPEKFSWIRNSDWFTSPTDIVPGENSTVEIEGKRVNAHSFIGKSILFDQTRMQVTALHHKEVHTVSLINFLSILRRITHARLIARDFFQDRLASGGELYLHEMMYPIFQAIDSDVIAKVYGSCDLEIGGSDQTFNMLMGRDVMRVTGQTPQAVLSMDLLEGIDGKEKMSKSLGNYIAITDAPEDMYGKVMSIPDALIVRYAELATYMVEEHVKEMRQALSRPETNPRDLKMSVARQIVAIYHGEKKADEAEASFVRTFQKGGLPEEIQVISVTKGEALLDILLREKILDSKNVFKRYITEGAISEHEGEKITDPTFHIKKNIILRIGKKTFVKIVLS